MKIKVGIVAGVYSTSHHLPLIHGTILSAVLIKAIDSLYKHYRDAMMCSPERV